MRCQHRTHSPVSHSLHSTKCLKLTASPLCNRRTTKSQDHRTSLRPTSSTLQHLHLLQCLEPDFQLLQFQLILVFLVVQLQHTLKDHQAPPRVRLVTLIQPS